VSKFTNKKSVNFLDSIPKKSLGDTGDKTTQFIKFNFHYIDSTAHGGDSLEDWSNTSTGRTNLLLDLMNKIKELRGRSDFAVLLYLMNYMIPSILKQV